MTKRFKESFCRHFNCAPENYVREAMDRTLHPHAAKLGPLMRLLCSLPCRRLLEEAGKATSLDDVQHAIQVYRADLKRNGGLWRRRFKFRISGQRLLNLYITI